MKLSSLRSQVVIDVHSGERLGNVIDLDVDFKTGFITGLVVGSENNFMSFFGKDQDKIVPWHCIAKIGKDAVLINRGNDNAE